MFVNDGLHLNSCHSSVKGREGGENVCFLASDVLRMNLFYISLTCFANEQAKFSQWCTCKDSPPMSASDESPNFREEDCTLTQGAGSICLLL